MHNQSMAAQCASGFVTGTELDLALCEVVSVNLTGNGMQGELPGDELCALASLQELDVSDNRISGRLGQLSGCFANLRSLTINTEYQREGVINFGQIHARHVNRIEGDLPAWLLRKIIHHSKLPSEERLTRLHLAGNSFRLVSIPEQRKIATACRASATQIDLIDCSGLPPLSCTAFGPERYVVDYDGLTCVECPHWWVSASFGLALLVLLFVALASVLWCVMNGAQMRRHLSTAIVLINQLQVLCIIGNMRLEWPPIMRALFSLILFDWFRIPWVRIECAIQLDAQMMWLIGYAQIVVTLLVLGGLVAWRSFQPGTVEVTLTLPMGHKLEDDGDDPAHKRKIKIHKRLCRALTAATREQRSAVLFFVFACIMTSTLRMTYSLLSMSFRRSGSDPAVYWVLGIVFSLLLLGTTFSLMFYYLRVVQHGIVASQLVRHPLRLNPEGVNGGDEDDPDCFLRRAFTRNDSGLTVRVDADERDKVYFPSSSRNATGLRWLRVETRPIPGTELNNVLLKQALSSRLEAAALKLKAAAEAPKVANESARSLRVAKHFEFSSREWEAFGLNALSTEHYVSIQQADEESGEVTTVFLSPDDWEKNPRSVFWGEARPPPFKGVLDTVNTTESDGIFVDIVNEHHKKVPLRNPALLDFSDRDVTEMSVYELLTIRFIDHRKCRTEGGATQIPPRKSSLLGWLCSTLLGRDFWVYLRDKKCRVWANTGDVMRDDSRFPRPQYWQFVIVRNRDSNAASPNRVLIGRPCFRIAHVQWLRQTLLFLMTCSLDVFLDMYVPSDADEEALTGGAEYSAILFGHAILIFLTLCFFANWHWQAWPYRLSMQNYLELFLCKRARK